VGAASIVRQRLPTRTDERAGELQLLTLFGPAIAAAANDPRALLTWQPVALTARDLFPSAFSALDRAHGARFPFSVDQIQAAHSRWTADWLAWERAHDAEFKLRALMLAHELGDEIASTHGRARADAIEREKLDLYQRRYEEYSRVARALQALLPRP
jgi:hypothetical protein